MVDPENNTDYRLSNWDLEERILFWICAAGKNGRVAARSLQKLLIHIDADILGPIRAVYREWATGDLPGLMKFCGIGSYTSKSRSFSELSSAVILERIDLRTCTTEDLEKIHGIGMKTSRCFIIHSRPGARYAGLDTHILKYLREKGIKNVPKSTPSRKDYLRLENEFLLLADREGKSPADLDLEIWNRYSVKVKGILDG